MTTLRQNNSTENQENGNSKLSLKTTGQTRLALSNIGNNKIHAVTKLKTNVVDENGASKQSFKFFKSKNENKSGTTFGLKNNAPKQSFAVFCDEPAGKASKQKQNFAVFSDSDTLVETVDKQAENQTASSETHHEPESSVVETDKAEAQCDKEISQNGQIEDRILERVSVSPSDSNKENEHKQPLEYTEELGGPRESIFAHVTASVETGLVVDENVKPSLGGERKCTSTAVLEPAGVRLVQDDSQFSEEYTVDIYKYLRDIEDRLRPRHNYMKKQPDITPAMRSILVDWLVEVSDEYKLHDETLHLAVSYIDRFLSHMSVLRGKLQLVGTAAMFVASKYEEIYPPEVSEFVYITDDTYTKKQVLRMEHLILKVLAFDLASPTSLYFIHRFVRLEKTSNEVKHLAMFLCQISLMESDPFLRFLPSLIAAGAFAVARHTFESEPWTSNLEESTGYRLTDLREVCYYLHKSFVAAPLSPQQAIVEKFKSSRYSFVSQVRPRPLFSFSE